MITLILTGHVTTRRVYMVICNNSLHGLRERDQTYRYLACFPHIEFANYLAHIALLELGMPPLSL